MKIWCIEDDENINNLITYALASQGFEAQGMTCYADFTEKLKSETPDLILLDIYPARELPIEGVSSQMLLDKVSIENKRVLSKQELVEYVRNGSFEVFATIGAGDVDRMIPQLKQALEEC